MKFISAFVLCHRFPDLQPSPAGKTIKVTGEIITYKGVPEIIADSPSQIEVVR